jgi:hypothetical protein
MVGKGVPMNKKILKKADKNARWESVGRNARGVQCAQKRRL